MSLLKVPARCSQHRLFQNDASSEFFSRWSETKYSAVCAVSSAQNRKHRPKTNVREVGFRLILPLVTLLGVFLLFYNKLLL